MPALLSVVSQASSSGQGAPVAISAARSPIICDLASRGETVANGAVRRRESPSRLDLVDKTRAAAFWKRDPTAGCCQVRWTVPAGCRMPAVGPLAGAVARRASLSPALAAGTLPGTATPCSGVKKGAAAPHKVMTCFIPWAVTEGCETGDVRRCRRLPCRYRDKPSYRGTALKGVAGGVMNSHRSGLAHTCGLAGL